MNGIKGPFTGLDLSLAQVPELFSGGQARMLSGESAALALEIAATAYSRDLMAWRQAGWLDITRLDYVRPGVLPVAGALAGLRELQQALPWEALPLRFLKTAAEPRENGRPNAPDGAEDGDRAPGKALLMSKGDGRGSFVVVLAFRGTGGSLRDWEPNFDCEPQEGFHGGFLGLVRRFERESAAVGFPQTAAQAGRARLSFADILREAARPGSPFRLFLVGYSQGGALMQVWAARRLRDGVLPDNLFGCGFASPSVRFGAVTEAEKELPLFHLVNSDDIVPRVGAEAHLGRLLRYPADEALRRACYNGLWEDGDFRRAIDAVSSVRGTREANLAALAMFSALETLPQEEASAVIRGLLESLRPDPLALLSAERPAASIRFMQRRARRNLMAITGRGLDPEAVAALSAAIGEDARRVGVRRYAGMLLKALAFPHLLVREAGEGIGAYQYIVTWGAGRLISSCG